jgi:hypothetical protein
LKNQVFKQKELRDIQIYEAQLRKKSEVQGQRKKEMEFVTKLKFEINEEN